MRLKRKTRLVQLWTGGLDAWKPGSVEEKDGEKVEGKDGRKNRRMNGRKDVKTKRWMEGSTCSE